MYYYYLLCNIRYDGIVSGDGMDIDQVPNNRLVLQIDNRAVDNAARPSGSRSGDDDQWGEGLIISNLQNNQYIFSNQYGYDYATEIQIKFPKNEEMTPCDIEGVRLTYETEVLTKDGVVDNATVNEIIPFRLPTADDNQWRSVDINRIYRGYKNNRDGTKVNVAIAEIQVQPKQFITCIKLPSDAVDANNTKGIRAFTAWNGSENNTKTIRLELPPNILENERGPWGWIKTAYKGVMWVAKGAQQVARIVDVVATTVINVGTAIERAAAPIVELLDLAEDIAKKGGEPKLVITDERYQNERADPANTYSLTDDWTSGLLSSTFDPTIAIEEGENNNRIQEIEDENNNDYLENIRKYIED